MEGSILPPGVIRCNETNPCHGFVFENVKMNAWYDKFESLGFITENVYGQVIDSYPDPGFMEEPSMEEPTLEEPSMEEPTMEE